MLQKSSLATNSHPASNTAVNDFAICRLNTDGTLDNTFGATLRGGSHSGKLTIDIDADGFDDRATALGLQGDKIIVAGSYQPDATHQSLEASAAHKGRTGRNHLRILCRSVGIPMQRADEVLELVGLTPAGGAQVQGLLAGQALPGSQCDSSDEKACAGRS